MKRFSQFIQAGFIEQEFQFSEIYRYIDKYKSPDMYEVEYLVGNLSVKENQTIWIMWMQGIENAPDLVKKCCDSICKNKPDNFEVVLLTLQNISEYIKLPDYIWEKYYSGVISATHFSDVVRVELLAVYGGCWIDATVFCETNIPLYMVSDMFLFKLESVLSNPVIKMSSWWLAADKKNRIIHATRHMLHKYWYNEEQLCDYFLLHIIMSKIIDEDSACQVIFQDIPYFNSRNAHILIGKLGMQYCSEEWRVIRDSSFVQKLTYKKRHIQGDGYNFYMALLDGKLD